MIHRSIQIFLFSLLVLLLSACQEEAHTLTPMGDTTPLTKEIAPTSTLSLPLPTVTSPMKIPLSIEVIGSPTPGEAAEKEEKFPGFATVAMLPDDILLPGEVNEEGNMIDSLAVFGIGGGGECPVTSPTLFFGNGSVSGCGFSAPENIIVEMIRPDDSVAVVRFRDDDFHYCFDNSLMLQPGRYTLRVTTESLPVETQWFNVSPAAQPHIFLSKTSPGFLEGCMDTIVENQPVQIFFDGFQPDERLVVALYFEDRDSYEIIRTWPAQVDDSGRLVQEIAAPQVKETGFYGIAVFGQTMREVSFLSTEKFMASAAASVRVVEDISKAEAKIVSATITPRPSVPTLTPSYICQNAPEIRVEVGDSIRVTYTDGTPLRLRSSPEVRKDNIVELIPEGTRMTVLDGPECAPRPGRSDSFVFWKVRVSTSGLTGWVAEGDLHNYYIEKYP